LTNIDTIQTLIFLELNETLIWFLKKKEFFNSKNLFNLPKQRRRKRKTKM